MSNRPEAGRSNTDKTSAEADKPEGSDAHEEAADVPNNETPTNESNKTVSNKRYSLIFPGQGSQSAGMLAELGKSYAIIKETFAEASDVLGYDIWALTQNGPDEQLRQTRYTQPVMYTSGVAINRLWRQHCDQAPTVVAGHSLGEYAALTAAGCLPFAKGIKLVAQRAQLMSDAVPEGEGGMAALLGMDDQAVIELCQSITGERIVEAANFNAPGQVAVSGHVDAIERLIESARSAGARKAVMLAVSVPNHSTLMREAGEKLADLIDTSALVAPKVPVMQNTEAKVAVFLSQLIAWLKVHVYSPVYWTDSHRRMIEAFKPEVMLELGPGKVLAGLGKRIDRSVPVLGVDTPESLELALAEVLDVADATV